MDSWIQDNMYKYGEELTTKVRDLITKIEEKGYYYESEADVLNLVADAYNSEKKKNK